jgi:hypothetical protein
MENIYLDSTFRYWQDPLGLIDLDRMVGNVSLAAMLSSIGFAIYRYWNNIPPEKGARSHISPVSLRRGCDSVRNDETSIRKTPLRIR